MGLSDRLLCLINTENKKNPYVDTKLAKMLSTARENVTAMRKELNIPNSRERRRPYLENAVETILEGNESISISDATKQLVNYGFNVSRHVVEEILKGRKTGQKTACFDTDPFQSLIGGAKSLKTCITQAKAAVLYPPLGLPTLIIGESGVGKTQFAEIMYKFASSKWSLPGKLPFVVFNCADYGDNPQLLLSVLYGYKKGTFTGANEDKEGIVETANNGILFLDEIHRLPPKGQEMLFSILDRGVFRRLGETNVERKVNMMLIGATTEDIQSSLLVTFRRRIPMIITIPTLQQRSVVERIQLIQYFFQQECNRINIKIFVEAKVIEIFAVSKFNGNIGELKSKIQVTCARAFMKYINEVQETILINTSEIFNQFVEYKNLNLEGSDMIQARSYAKDMIFVPFLDNEISISKHMENDEYSLPKDFYKKIEQKYYELKNDNMGSEDIERVLWKFVNKQFKKLEFTDNKNNIFSLSELVSLVDIGILKAVDKLRSIMEEEYSNCKFNERIFTCLAIHLQETMTRLRLNRPIINMNLSKIKKEIHVEYELAERFGLYFGKIKKVTVPKDEVGFIAMYIKSAVQDKFIENHVGVIIISHGRIASEIINVVNTLLNTDFPVAIDMPLTENPSVTYERIIDVSRKVDNGRGILFLVDMGSLVNAGDIVSEKLNIKTRTIDKIDLLTVIEAVRKASTSENDLDSIYFNLIQSRYGYSPLHINVNNCSKQPAILTLCLTGRGTARRIREQIYSRYKNIRIFEIGIMDNSFSTKLEQIKQEYRIVAAIGTINPEIEGINFIPYEPDSFNHRIRKLDFFLYSSNKNDLNAVINEDLILFEPNISDKDKLVDVMCSFLINNGYVNKKFIDSVLKRENISSTFCKGGLALPHGDFSEVMKSAIVFAKLKSPIEWDGGKASIVCLPALRINDKKIVMKLLKPFLNMNFMDKLKKSRGAFEFKNIVLNEIEKSQK